MWRSVVLVLAMLGCLAAREVQAGDGVETAGDVLTVVLPAAAGGLILAHRDTDGALQFVESAALAGGVTLLLKYTVDEKRPNGESHSFPSLHSSASFTSAEFIRKRYGWEYGVPAYALASFVAYSRVESDNHFAHDVIAGAAIGIGSSFLFTRPFLGMDVKAEGDGRYFGMRLSRAW